jgi:hypothetical protein
MLSDDCLAFYVDGAWVHYSLSSAEWSDDGRELVLYMEAGEDLVTRMNPVTLSASTTSRAVLPTRRAIRSLNFLRLSWWKVTRA